ncbi:MAG: DUF5711 family protein [Acutalibacteraceae bacterium]
MKIKFKELNSGYEGTKRVSRFSKKTHSKMIIAGVLVVLFLVVFILSNFGIIPLSAVTAKVKTFVSHDNGNFPIVINSDSTLNIKNLDDRILILTTENFSVYSSHGKLSWSQPHSFSEPAVSVNGDKAVVFDRGGTGFMLINKSGVAYVGEADNDIICAEYGKSGNYALVTRGDSATSVLTVYTKRNKVDFQWNCAYEHITSVALSGNGKFCGVSVLGAENGEIYTTVKYFGFDYSEALNSQKFIGATPFSVEFTANNILTLYSDTGIYEILKKDEKSNIVNEYHSFEFNSYDVNNKGYYALSLSNYGSTDENSVKVYNGSGKEKAEIVLDKTVVRLALSDKYVFALTDNSVLVYNFSGMKLSEINIVGEAENFYPTDEFIFVGSLDKISRIYSFGNKELKIVK